MNHNTRESNLRTRGFRQAVIEAYDNRCAVCGLKIFSPDSIFWEVEAAHIVPNSLKGKDDLWNGIALCHLHHWAFDVGWFTIQDDYKIILSPRSNGLPEDYGKIGEQHFLQTNIYKNRKILLPDRDSIYPHKNSLQWHRENIYYP